MRAKTKTLLLLIFSIVASGCIDLKQPAVEIDYYTLEYAPPAMAQLPALPVVLHVLPLRCATLYQSTQIVFRPSPFKRDAFIYHRWRTSPDQMVSAGLLRDFQYSALFEAVLPAGSRVPATHRLEGTVDEFYARSENDSWTAVLGLSLTLTSVSEETPPRPIALQRQFSVSQACPSKTPQGVAQALSTALQKLSVESIMAVYAYLQHGGSAPDK